MTPKHHLETSAAHLEPSQVAAEISPLLRTSTTYRRAPNNQLMDPANVYGRDQNDTVRQAEAVLAQMESAAAALLWPSGMAAISAVFRILPIGSRIVVQTGIYWGTTFWLRQFCEEQGHELVEVDAANGADLERISVFDPALVFVETPSNPWLKVVDIADMRRRFPNAYLVVDSTAATPALTRPLDLGADLVVHSATKALNGHSDVIAGVTLTAQLDDRWARLAQHRATGGAIIGPFEAWLLLRSLRTFPLRLRAMCDNALRLATYLLNHPLIEDVFYPGLPSSPYHAIATQQMQGGYGYLM